MDSKYTIIKIVLSVIIVVLAYLLFESLMAPIRFEKSALEREKAVVQKLIDLRNGQQFYKQLNGKYMSSFDTLIDFLRNSEIPIIKKVADPTDTTFTRTIIDTVGYVRVADSLFKTRKNYSLDSLMYIPYSNGEKFEMKSGAIERGGVTVPVFEISAHYSTFLKGLNRQLVINLIKSKEDLSRFPGLKVGSMDEPSTDGNWE